MIHGKVLQGHLWGYFWECIKHIQIQGICGNGSLDDLRCGSSWFGSYGQIAEEIRTLLQKFRSSPGLFTYSSNRLSSATAHDSAAVVHLGQVCALHHRYVCVIMVENAWCNISKSPVTIFMLNFRAARKMSDIRKGFAKN